LAVKIKKRGVVRAGAERLPGPRFLPEGLGLDGLGPQAPDFRKMGVWAGAEAETIRQPRDRLKGQPQERQHSAAEGGTRDRLPPAGRTLLLYEVA
jgi:hypothetical protein